MYPVSLDLQLARFSGLTSLNLLCWSGFGNTEEDSRPGWKSVLYTGRENFTLQPEALEKLVCMSGSLQKLHVAFTEDTEVTFDLSLSLFMRDCTP